MKIGVIVAMESEYEALLNAGVENVVKAGIGKVNAARATAELILTERPDCIINSGVAGGIDNCLKVEISFSEAKWLITTCGAERGIFGAKCRACLSVSARIHLFFRVLAG